ncbi:MAG: hypothetical protein ACFFFK_11790, partial [Candidatus Thorarchaeota archaeon]
MNWNLFLIELEKLGVNESNFGISLFARWWGNPLQQLKQLLIPGRNKESFCSCVLLLLFEHNSPSIPH